MSTNQCAIGTDLGGTKIEVALISSSGLLHDRLLVSTDSKKGYKAILKKITETIHQLFNKNGNAILSAVGIGIHGQISILSGIVHYEPNSWISFSGN
jgi:glucokinase